MNKLVILGLTGLMGSGKSHISKLFEVDSDFKIIRLGEYLRKNIVSKDKSVQNLENEALGIKTKLSQGSLGEFFAKEIDQCLKDKKILVVDSIRTKEDINFFGKKSCYFKMVMILSNQTLRYNRIVMRGRDFDPKNINEFHNHDHWEMEFGLKDIFPITDKFIINESDINYCYRDIRDYIKGV